MNRAAWMVLVSGILALPVGVAAGGEAAGGDGGAPGSGPGFGPGPRGFMRGGAAADFETVKAKLRASDEEWKVIGPKLQKVMIARLAADSVIFVDNDLPADGRGGLAPGERGRGRGGPGNGAFDGPSNKIGGGFGPGGGPPPGFGPGGGPPPGFGPGGGPPPRFGPGGGPPPGFGGPDSAVAQAQATLRTALADPKTTAQELQEKVAEVRAARQRARRDLAAAEKDLLELLTVDQEATLVSLGYID